MKFSSKTMNLNIKNQVAYLTFKKLEEFKFIRHAFSTRLGGVSSGNFATLNLSKKIDDEEKVEENIQRFCNSAGFDRKSLCLIKQNHGKNIKVVTNNQQNNGEFFDGSITNVKNLTLVTLHADCSPIFIVDPVTKSIGMLHAGWRGAVADISKEAILKMKSNFGSSAENLICCIGPSIGPCCFEIQEDIQHKFEKISPKLIKKRDDKIYVDIFECNKINLLESGVKEENIFISDLCTKCNHELLFSYRQQGKIHGNMAAMIELI